MSLGKDRAAVAADGPAPLVQRGVRLVQRIGPEWWALLAAGGSRNDGPGTWRLLEQHGGRIRQIMVVARPWIKAAVPWHRPGMGAGFGWWRRGLW